MNKLTQAVRIDTPPPEFRNLRNLTIPKLIPPLVNLVIIVAIVLFVFSLLIGGIKLIVSGGNKDNTSTAWRQIVNALIGIVIVFCTWAIISIVEQFFGVKITTLQFPRVII